MVEQTVLNIEEKRAHHEETLKYVFRALDTIHVFTTRVTAMSVPVEQRVQWLDQTVTYIDNVQGKYEHLFARVPDPKVKKCKKGFTSIKNAALSLKAIIEEGELEDDELAEYDRKQKYRCEKLSRLILEVSKKVNSSLDKRKAKLSGKVEDYEESSEEDNADEGASMKVINTETAGQSIDDILKEAGPLLQSYGKKYSSKMPTLVEKKKPFLIKRLPVIPLFVHQITAKDLEDAGFQVSTIGKYLVIENQLLVAENVDLMAHRVEKKVKNPDTKKNETVLVKDKEDAPELKDVIDAIQDKTKKRYIDMIALRSYNGFNWHWLVEERLINNLQAKRKHFSLRQWGFPFKPPR